MSCLISGLVGPFQAMEEPEHIDQNPCQGSAQLMGRT
jgi:hypothetical protein